MKTVLLVVALMLWCVALDAQDAKTGERLKKDRPKIEWNADSATKVDIDCDGKPDTFYWGIDPAVSHTYHYDQKDHTFAYREVAFGFEFGNDAKSQQLNVPFLKNTCYYGFRTEPTKIEVQPLSCDWEGGTIPGCVKKDRCESIWVRDGKGGDAFLFWDAERKQVGWIKH